LASIAANAASIRVLRSLIVAMGQVYPPRGGCPNTARIGRKPWRRGGGSCAVRGIPKNPNSIYPGVQCGICRILPLSARIMLNSIDSFLWSIPHNVCSSCFLAAFDSLDSFRRGDSNKLA
jgi:hypothetical protein